MILLDILGRDQIRIRAAIALIHVLVLLSKAHYANMRSGHDDLAQRIDAATTALFRGVDKFARLVART